MENAALAIGGWPGRRIKLGLGIDRVQRGQAAAA